MSAQETPPVDELFADLDLPDIAAEVFADADQGADRDGRWRIDSLGKAQWAMAKLKAARQQIAELTDQRNAQMELAEAWFARVVKEPRRFAGYLEAELVDYAMRNRDAGVLTTILPNGEIPTRKGAEPCVDVDDEDALLAWATDNAPAIVTVQRSVKLTDLRTVAVVVGGKAVTKDGELIPGATVRAAGSPTAKVKPF